MDAIASEARHRHSFAFAPRPDERSLPLDPGGVYQWRATGEKHLFNPTTIHKLAESHDDSAISKCLGNIQTR